jgi:hypothetical protein
MSRPRGVEGVLTWMRQALGGDFQVTPWQELFLKTWMDPRTRGSFALTPMKRTGSSALNRWAAEWAADQARQDLDRQRTYRQRNPASPLPINGRQYRRRTVNRRGA